MRRALVAGCVAALALACAAATCRGGEAGGGAPGERAEPAEVEIDWPDAGMMPPPASGHGAGAPESDAGA